MITAIRIIPAGARRHRNSAASISPVAAETASRRRRRPLAYFIINLLEQVRTPCQYFDDAQVDVIAISPRNGQVEVETYFVAAISPTILAPI